MIENPMEKKNQLLDDYQSKKITMEEIERECSYWFLECFPTIHRKPYPSMPTEYRDYLNLPFERRRKIETDFWFQPVIKTYLEIKNQIKNENNANLYHLHNYLKFIPEEDTITRQKFNQKIDEFEIGR